MEIVITLRRHCIKTGIKRRYNQLINQYFCNTLPDQEKIKIEVQIEALKFFLENADFEHLRRIYPELSGIDELSVTLIIPKNHNEITIAYDDRIIKPELGIYND